ncbi:hypothetical protein O181_005524 [Austropuccinia psidii MF-1]|uniref:Reverse transcriptase Ty1/copia-type domain-containing protein n=1 Tax=Austropuccinia psidii MF-1 TaxID=1389203 RepID=A0A9Q3BHL6_9BASI|nr:hypothetical protein [Austropuccinia psidii MF-1]
MNKLQLWDVIELKEKYCLVGTTWVFKIKKNHLNKIIEYKAQLCAQGFTQTNGIDFFKTYAPTGCLNSLRTLIAYEVENNLEFHQIDINSAFLNASLSETVYLAIPQGLNLDPRKKCLLLNKAICGLKQAPLALYQRLKDWLNHSGYTSCILDLCVFYKIDPDPIWIYFHVDDIAILYKDATTFKHKISSELDIKDIGIADLILGIKINHHEDGVSLNQHHFIEALLELYGMSQYKTVTTPLVPNSHLTPATEVELKEFNTLTINFRSAIGSLNYLSTATCPDLSSAVSTLSQYLEKLGIKHWSAFLHVLKYLKGSQELGLIYKRIKHNGIEA